LNKAGEKRKKRKRRFVNKIWGGGRDDPKANHRIAKFERGHATGGAIEGEKEQKMKNNTKDENRRQGKRMVKNGWGVRNGETRTTRRG